MFMIEELLSSPEEMKEFQRERLGMEITELICQTMEQEDVTRAELARRLGTSPPYVTKLLRGGSNMTVQTISDVFYALGKSLRVVAQPLSMWSPTLLVMEAQTTAPDAQRIEQAYQVPASLEMPSVLGADVNRDPSPRHFQNKAG